MERRNELETSDGQSGRFVVTAIPNFAVATIWPAIEPLLEEALRVGFGQHTLEDVYEELVRCTLQLWVGHTGGKEPQLICITKVDDFPALKTCTIAYMAGSGLDEFIEPLHNTIIAWARTVNCDSILSLVWRKGLEKKLAKQHWALGPRIMTLELKNVWTPKE